MRLAALFFFLFAVTSALANTIILVDLATNEKGTTYFLNGKKLTLVELKELLTLAMEAAPNDPILLRPDRRTSFQEVFELLQMMKAAGVDRMEVMADADPADKRSDYLSVRANNLRTVEFAENPSRPIPTETLERK